MKKKIDLSFITIPVYRANYHDLCCKEEYSDSESLVQQDGLHQIVDLVRYFEAGLVPVSAVFPPDIEDDKKEFFDGEFDEKDIDKLEPDEDDEIEEDLDESKTPEPEPKKPEPEPVKEEKKDDKAN